MDNEERVVQLIALAGDARSKYLEALTTARKRNYIQSDELLSCADRRIVEAYRLHKELLRAGVDDSLTMLMVHGQDHLMNAVTVKEMAIEMIAFMKEVRND